MSSTFCVGILYSRLEYTLSYISKMTYFSFGDPTTSVKPLSATNLEPVDARPRHAVKLHRRGQGRGKINQFFVRQVQSVDDMAFGVGG